MVVLILRLAVSFLHFHNVMQKQTNTPADDTFRNSKSVAPIFHGINALLCELTPAKLPTTPDRNVDLEDS